MIAQAQKGTTLSEIEGCYHLRGPDFETIMVSEISETLIDADRLVRCEFRNGFPNWDLYRVALAGDDRAMERVRHWVVAFAIAYCMSGGVKRKVYTEELATVAGWDALHILIYTRPLAPYYSLAEDLGVHDTTYLRLRNALAARLKAGLDEYWIRLEAAVRHVFLYERKRRNRNQDV